MNLRLCRLAAATAILCLRPALCPAQSPGSSSGAASTATTSARPDGLWRCQLPGGVYLVALRSIVSISSHDYVVDGLARVTEVNVATASTVEARFYYLEPLPANLPSAAPGASSLQTLQQHVQDLSASHGDVDQVWQKVVKNYPSTTHAHTVEYRLNTKADLQNLYNNLELSWTTGKGANFKIE